MTDLYEPVGSAFLVNTHTSGDQAYSTITGLANGGFVVTWVDFAGTLGDVSEGSIRAQIFDANGVMVGGEFLVNTQTSGSQIVPTITSLANGGFVVTWQDDSGTLGDASGHSIKAQIFDATGVMTGSEFLVNTQTSGDQDVPTITGLANGGFVVTWQDAVGDFSDPFFDSSIKAQIYDANGGMIGSEFVAATQTFNQQVNPAIASLANGGFVVTWWDFSSTLGDASATSIKAQIFDAAGAMVGGEFLVNTQTSGQQNVPTIAGLAGGGFVVTWFDYNALGDPSATGFKAQIFDANGGMVGSELLVAVQTASGQGFPTITGLANGGFVVTWTIGSGIKAQIFAANGAMVGDEFRVDAVTSNNQFSPTIASLTDGSFVVTWSEFSVTPDDANFSSVRAQIFGLVNNPAEITGTSTGAVVEAGGVGNGNAGIPEASGLLTVTDPDPGQSIFATPDAASLVGSFGTFTFDAGTGAWTYTLDNDRTATQGIALGQFGGDTLRVSSIDGTASQDISINITGANDAAAIGGDTTGTVTESSALGGVSQTTGTLTISDIDSPSQFNVGNTVGQYGTLTLAAGGGWTYVLDNANAQVDGLSTGESLNDNIVVTAADGTTQTIALTITGADDIRTGTNGVDTLTGTNGNDTLTGNGGNDTLNGGLGNDTLDGGAGNDMLNGGDGTDTASYLSATGAVKVSLASSGAQQTGGAGRDTLGGMENLVGSAFNDTLTGSGAANTLNGGAGGDKLTGGGGGDLLIGGLGDDQFIFLSLTDSTVAAPDTIMDFDDIDGLAGDRIDLSKVDAIGGGKNNAFSFIGELAFTNVAGQLRTDSSNQGYTIVQGDTNGDGLADLQFVLQWADSQTPLTLGAQDFIL